MENTKTKFRPILFSTPMVQALLEGRKTMTRRIKGLEKFNEAPDSWRYDGFCEEDKTHYMELISSDGQFTEKYFEVVCPYKVGDVFWVRETFYKTVAEELNGAFFYKADVDKLGWTFKWKPSLFMPKEACRIFLKIKSIKVERLHDISEEDAIAEGVNCLHPFYEDYLEKASFFHLASESFITLWKKINKKESWNHNPFVFVYEFEQIEKPLDFIL